MSQFITEAFVQQYSANIFHLSQQKGSRPRPFVRQESQTGKASFYDRLGQVTAVKKTGRHSDTPQLDTPHSRRRVTLSDYEWADLIDSQDKVRLLNDPTSEYVMAAMWAMGRAMDDEIILAALGTAYAGEDGSTSVVLPNSQKYAANNGSSFTDLNVKTLRGVKRKFDANDIDESIERHIAVTSAQIESMLGQTEVTSSDYNSVKALVDGKVDTFMGFKFHRIERLSRLGANGTATIATGVVGSGVSLAASTSRRCFAWAGDGILLAIGSDIKARISERDDKSYSTQAYASMTIGGTRMEEEKVVEIICTES